MKCRSKKRNEHEKINRGLLEDLEKILCFFELETHRHAHRLRLFLEDLREGLVYCRQFQHATKNARRCHNGNQNQDHAASDRRRHWITATLHPRSFPAGACFSLEGVQRQQAEAGAG